GSTPPSRPSGRRSCDSPVELGSTIGTFPRGSYRRAQSPSAACLMRTAAVDQRVQAPGACGSVDRPALYPLVSPGPMSALALLATTTTAVHHLCITATAFGAIWRIRPPSANRMIGPKRANRGKARARIRLAPSLGRTNTDGCESATSSAKVSVHTGQRWKGRYALLSTSNLHRTGGLRQARGRAA